MWLSGHGSGSCDLSSLPLSNVLPPPRRAPEAGADTCISALQQRSVMVGMAPRPRGVASGLEPVRLCPQGTRDVRAGRTGSEGPPDDAHRGRNGLALPALRHVRDP